MPAPPVAGRSSPGRAPHIFTCSSLVMGAATPLPATPLPGAPLTPCTPLPGPCAPPFRLSATAGLTCASPGSGISRQVALAAWLNDRPPG